MTAVDLDALDKLRGAVAEALWDDMAGQVVGAIPRMPRRAWDDAGAEAKARFLRQADVAIAAIREGAAPLVDRIANERAAAELRAAADEAWEDSFEIARDLRRRADALDPT